MTVREETRREEGDGEEKDWTGLDWIGLDEAGVGGENQWSILLRMKTPKSSSWNSVRTRAHHSCPHFTSTHTILTILIITNFQSSPVQSHQLTAWKARGDAYQLSLANRSSAIVL